MKSLKSGAKEQPAPSPEVCRIHKEPYSMICLHAGCHSNYKLLCVKCKKQKHYQHPNRTISLIDFYQMLETNRLDFIENSLALTLVNIKNKLVYVSNFRIFIMQKESMLMDNARTIHNTIYRILQQKMHLKDLLSTTNNETQISDTQTLINNLDQIKKHISFNPIQNVIRINSEKVGVLKVELEKYCQTTKTVINDIRQYLVKIVEVMIEEQIQEEDIQYIEHEDVDEKIFNINVKKANHIEINEKQTRYKVEQLKEMFDELLNIQVQKNQEHIENDVQKLQEQIKIKQQIVKNIRRRSASKAAKYSHYDQIKQTTTPPGKSSLTSSQIQQNTNQKQKNPSKMSLNSPKLDDSKLLPKNVGKYQTASPKSPKMRSITVTDKGNTSPKVFVWKNDGPKNGNKQYGINKRTPKSQFKNQFQQSNNEIKQKKSNPNEQKQFKDQRELVLQSNIQKIDQSQEEQLLHTDNFNYRIYRESLKTKNQDQSLLLDTDSPQKIKQQKFTRLENKLLQFQHQNKLLKLQIDKKTKEIHSLQSTFQQYKQQMDKKLKNSQLQLKEISEKSKIDSAKEIPVKQEKSKIHLSPVNNNKERKTPQKHQDKLLKKTVQQNALNTKKLIDQKKQLQGKIQKLQKQVKQLKEKEANCKKQHLMHTPNLKELKEVKKRVEQLTKKNQELTKKNDDTMKKNQSLSKKNDQLFLKTDELNKKNDEINKKSEQLRKKNEQMNKKNEQMTKNSEQMNKKNEQMTKNSEQMNKKNEQMTKNSEEMRRKVEEMSKICAQFQGKLQDKDKQIEEERNTIEQQKNTIEGLSNQVKELKNRIEKQKQKYDLEYQLKISEVRLRLQKEIQTSETKTNNLENQLHHLQNQLNSSIQKQESLEQHLKQAQKIIQTQSLQINNYESEHNQLKQKEFSQIQIERLMDLNKSLQNQLTLKSIALKEKLLLIEKLQQTINNSQIVIQNGKQAIRKNGEQVQELKVKMKELEWKEQVLQTGNRVLGNKMVETEQIMKEHLGLIQYQKIVIRQKEKEISELNQQHDKHQKLLEAKQVYISQLNGQKEQLAKQNNQLKQSLTSKISEKAIDSVAKLEELEELAQKRIGEKVWLKDQEIQQLQQRNQLLSTELNQLKLKLTITDRLYSNKHQSFPNSLQNSVSLNDSHSLDQSYVAQSSFSSQNHPIKQELNYKDNNNKDKQQLSTPNKLPALQQQLNRLQSKYHKLQQKYHKLKNKQANHLKDHEKMKKQMMLHCQYLKTKYQEQKSKNEEYFQFDINNYVPLLKYKQLKEWYEIAMRKNHDLKEQNTTIKLQQSRLIEHYEEKLTQTINQSQTKLNQITKHYQFKLSQFNSKHQSKSKAPSTSFESISQINSGQLIKNCKESTQTSVNQINAQNSPIMLQRYSQISGIIHQITGDMLLLEQKVKENAVIQKVYLKELDRKRTENRKLRQQIDYYRNRQRKLVGVKTERYYEKGVSSGKLQKGEYKVYYATGFAGSESRLSGGSSLTPGHQYHVIQDKFSSSSPSPSTLSQNSNIL